MCFRSVWWQTASMAVLVPELNYYFEKKQQLSPAANSKSFIVNVGMPSSGPNIQHNNRMLTSVVAHCERQVHCKY